MKLSQTNIIAFILFLLSVKNVSAQTTREYLDYNFYKCSKDSALFYREALYDVDTIYHGRIKTYYISGKIYSDICYSHGKEEGQWTWWYENGQKKSERIYDFGNYHVKNSWSPSGNPWVVNGTGIDSNLYWITLKIQSIGKYSNGSKEGLWQFWHKNGQLDEISEFVNGNSKNVKELYDDAGVAMLKDGTGMSIDYSSKNKKTAVGNYKDGKRDGEWIWYYYYGDKTSTKCSYQKGSLHGFYTSWFPNGKKQFEGNYVNGNKDGEFKWYHWNGNPKETGEYKDGKYTLKNCWSENGKEMVKNGNGFCEFLYYTGTRKSSGFYDNGKKAGLWKWYYENGKLKEEGEYINDRYSIISFYDSSGTKTVSKGTGERIDYSDIGSINVKASYLNGKRHGLWTWYHDNGNIDETAVYENDSITGERFEYYENKIMKFSSIPQKDTTYKTWWYDNGQKEQESYNFKQRLYIVNRWDKDGIQKIKNGNGLYEEYNESGKLIIRGPYLNSFRDGKWEWFYQNGTPEEMIVYKAGKFSGKYISYNENGIKTFEGEMKNDTKNGLNIWYHENGNIRHKGNYIDGTPDGIHFFYDDDGKLIEKKKYNNGIPLN